VAIRWPRAKPLQRPFVRAEEELVMRRRLQGLLQEALLLHMAPTWMLWRLLQPRLLPVPEEALPTLGIPRD
jgi:hypothetical protein